MRIEKNRQKCLFLQKILNFLIIDFGNNSPSVTLRSTISVDEGVSSHSSLSLRSVSVYLYFARKDHLSYNTYKTKTLVWIPDKYIRGWQLCGVRGWQKQMRRFFSTCARIPHFRMTPPPSPWGAFSQRRRVSFLMLLIKPNNGLDPR